MIKLYWSIFAFAFSLFCISAVHSQEAKNEASVPTTEVKLNFTNHTFDKVIVSLITSNHLQTLKEANHNKIVSIPAFETQLVTITLEAPHGIGVLSLITRAENFEGIKKTRVELNLNKSTVFNVNLEDAMVMSSKQGKDQNENPNFEARGFAVIDPIVTYE